MSRPTLVIRKVISQTLSKTHEIVDLGLLQAKTKRFYVGPISGPLFTPVKIRNTPYVYFLTEQTGEIPIFSLQAVQAVTEYRNQDPAGANWFSQTVATELQSIFDVAVPIGLHIFWLYTKE